MGMRFVKRFIIICIMSVSGFISSKAFADVVIMPTDKYSPQPPGDWSWTQAPTPAGWITPTTGVFSRIDAKQLPENVHEVKGKLSGPGDASEQFFLKKAGVKLSKYSLKGVNPFANNALLIVDFPKDYSLQNNLFMLAGYVAFKIKGKDLNLKNDDFTIIRLNPRYTISGKEVIDNGDGTFTLAFSFSSGFSRNFDPSENVAKITLNIDKEITVTEQISHYRKNDADQHMLQIVPGFGHGWEKRVDDLCFRVKLEKLDELYKDYLEGWADVASKKEVEEIIREVKKALAHFEKAQYVESINILKKELRKFRPLAQKIKVDFGDDTDHLVDEILAINEAWLHTVKAIVNPSVIILNVNRLTTELDDQNRLSRDIKIKYKILPENYEANTLAIRIYNIDGTAVITAWTLSDTDLRNTNTTKWDKNTNTTPGSRRAQIVLDEGDPIVEITSDVSEDIAKLYLFKLEIVGPAPAHNQIEYAHIGHWGADSIPVINGEDMGLSGYDNVTGEALNLATMDNFVDRDPHRFYIRIYDGLKNIDASRRETIEITIGTVKNPNPEDDDDLTTIFLYETENNSGVFISQSQLLVGPDVPDNADDKKTVYDNYRHLLDPPGPVEVTDDKANDRTHKTSVDGWVQVKYQNRQIQFTSMDKEIPVYRRGTASASDLEERRVLNVQVHIFNEPWQDVGYGPRNKGAGDGKFSYWDKNNNKKHDPGEPCEPFIDISGGATNFSRVAGSWGTIWTTEDVDKVMKYTRALLAQAGIRLVEPLDFSGNPKRKILNPTGTLFARLTAAGVPIPNVTGYFDVASDQLTFAMPSTDENIIQANFRSDENTDADLDNDIVDIYFVPTMIDEGYYAFQYRPGFVSAQGIGAGYINQVFIGLDSSASHDDVPVAPIHELMHQLANRPDIPGPPHIPPYILFPVSVGAGPGYGKTDNSMRRITQNLEGQIRTPRDPANMGHIGNALLRSP